MNAKRGYVPEDEHNFSPESIKILRTASRHMTYLLNEGYGLKQAMVFVGNHFLLSERQRLAIMRSVASDAQIAERKHKQMPLDVLAGREIWIDGFNTIITQEVLLSDSPVFVCMDGAVRDLAALRGTYRLIPETEAAVRLLFGILEEAGVGKVRILLDKPVSNSGRLKSLMADVFESSACGFALDIQILPDVDRLLYEKQLVATSDSIIMDHCGGWVNLAAECMRRLGKTGLQVWEE